MSYEAGWFLLVLSAVTLWFNRWMVRQEIALFKAQLAAEKDKADRNAEKVEQNALPVIYRDDQIERQLEELAKAPKKDQEWYDEVPGLGR